MNEQNNDPYGIINSAEQLVAELWEAKKAEDVQENQITQEPAEALPCPEATEDEVSRVGAWAQALAAKSFEGFKGFTVAEVNRYGHDELIGIVVYEINGIVEYDCGECDVVHETSTQVCAIRIGQDGSLFPLESKTILDRRKEIMEKRIAQRGGPQVIRLSLDDLVDGIAGKLKEKMTEDGNGGNGGDDDDLPPAAIVEEAEPAAEITSTSVITIDEQVACEVDENDEELLGQIRRVWNRLWRR